ncbi:MAG: D-2-hydroxyacid dehydrogenase [Thiotrichales bacterium]|nr:D-2-hydroxyacid dehydrogenase [Thiotrichales bacterium]MCY4285297.1 D-2-hydroxyacid dehydrogenase [Thiotrichales bacterium]
MRIHVKNNHASPETFPPTPEGEAVFTITRERFDAAAARYPHVAERLDVCIDWDLDHFESSMRTAEVLVAWDLPTADLARLAPKLRLIHITGAGVEHLCPMDWVPEGVTVVNNRGAHADKAGEYGLMAMLMLHNHLPAILGNQRRAHWESLYSTPIAGKTLLVIGTGSIGAAAAHRCRALGVRVLGVSRHGRPLDAFDEMHTSDRLDALLPQADFVFVAVPLTPETRNLLDARRQALMKPGAGVINVGRAATMDYEALTVHLRSGRLSGAVLDVFDPEPLPPDSPLWHVPNLVLTPHVSADDGDAYVALTLELVFRNLERLLDGRPLANVVRPELGY